MARVQRPEVVGLGAMNMDLLYTMEQVVLDGESLIDDFTTMPGGSAANTIYGLAKLGVRAGFVGAVGNDIDGLKLTHDLREVGVDAGQVARKEDIATGIALGLSDREGVRSLYIRPGANNALTWDDINLDYVNQARVVHFSSFVSDAQLDIQERLADSLSSSVHLSCAPGTLYTRRGVTELRGILKRTGTLFLNKTEMRQLTGMSLRQGAQLCLRSGCETVVVTLGAGSLPDELRSPPDVPQTRMAAAYIVSRDGELLVDVPAVRPEDVVDTTGAGDAFAAGFLFGLLHRKGPEECGRLGDAVAKMSITRLGARSALPTLEELSAKYQEWYGRNP